MQLRIIQKPIISQKKEKSTSNPTQNPIVKEERRNGPTDDTTLTSPSLPQTLRPESNHRINATATPPTHHTTLHRDPRAQLHHLQRLAHELHTRAAPLARHALRDAKSERNPQLEIQVSTFLHAGGLATAINGEL